MAIQSHQNPPNFSLSGSDLPADKHRYRLPLHNDVSPTSHHKRLANYGPPPQRPRGEGPETNNPEPHTTRTTHFVRIFLIILGDRNRAGGFRGRRKCSVQLLRRSRIREVAAGRAQTANRGWFGSVVQQRRGIFAERIADGDGHDGFCGFVEAGSW